MGSMWKDAVISPLARILQVGLEGDLQTNGREYIVGTNYGLGRNLSRKIRGAELARLEELKVEKVEVVVSYIQKGDDYRVPV